jgi:DNA topoisomerase IA
MNLTHEEADHIMDQIKTTKKGKITKVFNQKTYDDPPSGMNTLNLLKICSDELKFGALDTLSQAETLYRSGFIR